MSTSYYDIVVIGMDLSGLIYAAQAAKAGYRVLVLGQDGLPAMYNHEGLQQYRHMPLLYGFRSSELMRNSLRDLGLYQEMRNKPEPLNPSFQMNCGSMWFSGHGDPKMLQAEYQREFGSKAREIHQFVTDNSRLGDRVAGLLAALPMLPADGFFARRALRKRLAQFPDLTALQAPIQFPEHLQFFSAFGGLLYLMAPVRPKPMNPLATRRLIHHAESGFVRFPAYADGFKQLFVGRLQARGGDVRPQGAASELLVASRKFTEIRLGRSDETVSFRLLVCNSSPQRFFKLIPPECRTRRSEAFMSSLEAPWVRYVVNFNLDPRLVPEGLAENLVQVGSPHRELHSENLLWVHRMPQELSGPNNSVLSVFCHLPSRELPGTEAEFAALNSRILAELRRTMPFLEDQRVLATTPYLARNRDTGHLTLNHREIQEVFGSTLPEMLDLSPVPMLAEQRNLLILGDPSFGALGLEGSFLSARLGLEWTLANVRLKKMKKD